MTRSREVDQAAVILNGLACGDFGCECANSVSRGRGMTHCPAHDDGHGNPDLNVELGDKGVVFHCHVCRDQDAVVAALRERGLWGRDANKTGYGALALEVANDQKSARIVRCNHTPNCEHFVCEYAYVDRDGNVIFYVERYEPKDFRQRLADGTRRGVSDVWTLYRLPQVIAAVARKETIFVCEGEKDADKLATLGVCSTTSPGGAGKWDDSYSELLIGANVVVCQDRDEINPKTGKRAGGEHTRAVAQSVSIGARTVKILEFPNAHDAADWVAAGGTKMLLETIVDDLPEWQSSEKVIYTARDLAIEFRDILAKRIAGDPEHVGWRTGFPSFDKEMRYRPEELWLVAASSGIGKTAFLTSLQRRAPVPSLMFSVEMSRTQIMNRLIAAEAQVDSWKLSTGSIDPDEHARVMAAVDAFEKSDIQLADNSALTTGAIESILRIARVRYGIRLVFVDYVGLLSERDGDSRYEKVTKITHDLMRIVKETKTCLIAASQVTREGNRKSGEPPFMDEMRDSGALEEDAHVVLAIGRAEGSSDAKVAVRKNRFGMQGYVIPLHFDQVHTEFKEPAEARRDRVYAGASK